MVKFIKDIFSKPKQEYVCGFYFFEAKTEADGLSSWKERVLLVKKNRPVWQAGNYNGVGGKVEKGESRRDAMVREFREETALFTTGEQWNYFGKLEGPDYIVHYYRAYQIRIANWTGTDEPIEAHPIDDIPKNFSNPSREMLNFAISDTFSHLNPKDRKLNVFVTINSEALDRAKTG